MSEFRYARRAVGKLQVRIYHTDIGCASGLETVPDIVVEWNNMRLCKVCEKREKSVKLSEVLERWLTVTPTDFIEDLEKSGFKIRRVKYVERSE